MKTDFSEFLKLVMVEFGTIPISGVAVVIGVSAASSAVEAFLLIQQNMYASTHYAVWPLLIAAWTVVIYRLSIMMAASRPAIGSFIRYVATAIATVLPLAAAFGLMLLSLSSGSTFLIPVVLVLLLSITFVSPLFAGWPIMQAISPTFVGPVAAWRLTRGFRWPLVAGGLVLGAINRSVPSPSETSGIAEVLVLAGVGAIASAFSGMIAVSISIAAWRLMLANQ